LRFVVSYSFKTFTPRQQAAEETAMAAGAIEVEDTDSSFEEYAAKMAKLEKGINRKFARKIKSFC
jgi:hypothetical protein